MLDQLVQNAREQHIGGQLLVLRWQGLACLDNVAQCDLDPVNRGQHGVNTGRILGLGWQHQGERKCGG